MAVHCRSDRGYLLWPAAAAAAAAAALQSIEITGH